MGLFKMRPSSLLVATLLLVLLAQRAAPSPVPQEDYDYDYYDYYAGEEASKAEAEPVEESVPESEPDVPIEEPELPVEEPEAPVDEPELPVEEPEVPVAEPEVPVEEPAVPAEEPEVPVEPKEEEVVPAVKSISFKTESVKVDKPKRAIPDEPPAQPPVQPPAREPTKGVPAKVKLSAPVKSSADISTKTKNETPSPAKISEARTLPPPLESSARPLVTLLSQSKDMSPAATSATSPTSRGSLSPSTSPPMIPTTTKVPAKTPKADLSPPPVATSTKPPAVTQPASKAIPTKVQAKNTPKASEGLPKKPQEQKSHKKYISPTEKAPELLKKEERPMVSTKAPQSPVQGPVIVDPTRETASKEVAIETTQSSISKPIVRVHLGGVPLEAETTEAEATKATSVAMTKPVTTPTPKVPSTSPSGAPISSTSPKPKPATEAIVPPTQKVTPKVKGREDPVTFPESCTQLPETGVCRGYFPMFYFDPVSRTCRQFVYGGCSGNENIHKTAAQCYQKCYPDGMSREHGEAHTKSTQSSERTFLSLHDGTGASILTFTGRETGAKVQSSSLDDFHINGTFQIQFYFRTDSPHGLIAFLRQESVPAELKGMRIQLYIYLKKGHLGLTHVFGNNTETFTMERGGLQGGNWHSAIVRIDSATGSLLMDVDSQNELFTIQSLVDYPGYTNGEALQGFKSSMWIGGVSSSDLEREDVVFGTSPFHGCLQDVKFLSGDSEKNLKFVKNPKTSKYNSVQEHCRNNCNSRHENFCGRNSHCVEHFDHSTCSCFNSGKDGRRCDINEVPVLSLSGDGYVVHRLYEWMDRVQSYTNLISLEFKTKFPDSILFYASSEHPVKQYLAASITREGRVYVEVDLGGGPAGVEVGKDVDTSIWHTLTLVHQHETIQVHFDRRHEETIDIPGEVRYFHFDPNFYLGNAPDLNRRCGLPVGPGLEMSTGCNKNQTRYFYDVTKGSCEAFTYSGCGGNVNRFDTKEDCMQTCSRPGLRSFNTFLGCVEKVFYNDVSLLLELQLNNRTTHYHGLTEPPLGTSCKELTFLPVTFSTENASVSITNENEKHFHISVSFKPSTNEGVLASGHLTTENGTTEWELWHDKNYVTFYIHDGRLLLKPDSKIKIGHWQYVEVHYMKNKNHIVMSVNQKKARSKDGELSKNINFSPEITIGSNVLDLHPGFVGCIRTLEIGGKDVPARAIVNTPSATKDVTFDNCKVLGPCQRPNACEHGGICKVVNNDIQCDCTGTGYTGRTCHFSLYRRSCEQYRQIGYNVTGIYKVDVDGNGPLPSAYVNCSYNQITRQTTTTVVHNLPDEYLVRARGEKDITLRPEYRDFTPDMFMSLISQSKSCEQEIKYNCRRSPLRLSTRTWFSSPLTERFTRFGSVKDGLCRCKDVNMCDAENVPCNCDVGDGIARSDVGKISDTSLLPVTSLTFLYDREGQKEDTEGRISLSPLMCSEEASAKHTVSFTNPMSYIQVPGWREGSFYLNFKTTSKRPVIAYQPANHPGHASFIISLAGDKELEFSYRHRGQVKRTTLISGGRLNTGRWHEVRIEINRGEMRFVLNSEEKLFNVDFDLVLDGSMYLGAIPDHVKNPEDDLTKLEGLVGCVRGLTLNDEVIDLKRYIRASAHGVKTGCQPSCDPNPCHNGAKCVELWGEYKCECVNPLAHFGKNCEQNINKNAVTFRTKESKIKYFTNDTQSLGSLNLLNSTFLLNFRTHDKKAMILFAHDSQHNFVQLFLAEPETVKLVFNYGKDIQEIVVAAENGVVFNKGQSVQVHVKRTETCTTLEIFTEGQTFSKMIHFGVSLIAPHEYEQFPFGTSRPLPYIVYYPHSPTKPQSYFQAYLGSGDDPAYDVKSMIEGLVGCLRGLRIGGKDVSLPQLRASSGHDVMDVEPDCNLACDQAPCKNGGDCFEDFKNMNNFVCDCTDTSYDGASCTAETSYVFNGNQWLSKSSNISILNDFTLELAFSASSIINDPQLVLLLRSTDPSNEHDYLLIGVEADGSLLVEAQFSDLDEDMVLGAKLTPSAHQVDIFDGYRHHVIVTKTSGDWTLQVDGQKVSIVPLKNKYVGTELQKKGTYLYLGGIETGIDVRLQRYQSFSGCISNVWIHHAQGVLRPLEMTLRRDLHISKSSLPPSAGSCAMFAAPGAPSILRGPGEDSAMLSIFGKAWDRPQVDKTNFEAPFSNDQPARETVFDNVVPAVAGAIFIVALIIVLILLLRMGKNRRKKEKQRIEEEEKEALLNGREPGAPITTAFTITNKNETLPLNAAPPVVEESRGGEMEMKEIPKLTEIPLTDAVMDAVKKAADEPDGDAPEDQKDSKRMSDSTAQDSPSSTRANEGSLLYIDEDAPTVKDSDEDEPSSVAGDKAKVGMIGEKDSSSEDEEIDVVNVSSVDDEGKKEEVASSDDGTEIDGEGDAKSEDKEDQKEEEKPESEKKEEEKPEEEKKEEEKPEGEETEEKYEGQKEEKQDDMPKEEEEKDDTKQEEEQNQEPTPEDKPAIDIKPAEETKDSSDSSDEEFIELRAEREPVQDARRMTSKQF